MRLLKYVLVIFCYVFVSNTKAQQREFTVHTVAFYNLENLFDIIDDPNRFDEQSPIMELSENRATIYSNKIRNMARVIADIGFEVSKNTPAILGVAEVENRDVLEDLINDTLLIKKDYGIIHFDAPDLRGIDVALLYQKQLFTPIAVTTYPLVLKDAKKGTPIYTRDQLVVSGLLDKDKIYILVNHWPSRRGGETKSNPKRIAAAKLNKRIIDSLQSVDPYAKIISMGDFNDDPTNASFKSVLNTKRKPNKVGLKGIYNPMEQLYIDGYGTTAYRDKWSLFDQILISKPLLETDYSTYRFYKAGIFNAQYLITQTGPYKGYPYRSFGYEGYTGGYSDHFPVYIYLIKEQRK